jgi:hypothetical protein
MKTISIQTVQKEAYKAPYFFDKGWMVINQQSMDDFKVKKSALGNIYIYAPSRWNSEFMGYTFHQFIDNDLIAIKEHFTTEKDILNYISSH